MSQIDQAFIHAYQSEETHLPPATPRESAPHISFPETAEIPASEVSTVMAPEPIPSPHFQVISSAEQSIPAYSESAVATESEPTVQPIDQAASGLDQTSSGRRPLSSFSAPEQPPPAAFRPVYEVDGFRWPTSVEDLYGTCQTHLKSVVDQLLLASDEGRSLVGIAGTHRAVGCTTVLMFLARMLSASGKSVALCDADFTSASLATELGLEFEIGWEDALAGRLPLAECVVHSLGDEVALLPLRGDSSSGEELLSGIQTSVSAGVLRYHYDLVLFDLGAATETPQQTVAKKILQQCRLDATIIVADSSGDDRASVSQIRQLMETFESNCLGLVGNSAPRS